MLKFVISLFFVIGLLFAAPSTKDVENAIKSGNYANAETMLKEVVTEKPNSAKAHYYLAQVLAHQNKYNEAKEQLNIAKTIEPSLAFGNPSKVNEFESKLNKAMNSKQITSNATSVQTSNANNNSSNFPWAWIVLAIAVLAILFMIFKKRQQSLVGNSGYSNNPINPYGANNNTQPNNYAQPNNNSSSMGSTIMGGLAAGAAAAVGMSVVDSLLHGHEAKADDSNQNHQNIPNNNDFNTFNNNDFDVGGGDWDSDSLGDSW